MKVFAVIFGFVAIVTGGTSVAVFAGHLVREQWDWGMNASIGISMLIVGGVVALIGAILFIMEFPA